VPHGDECEAWGVTPVCCRHIRTLWKPADPVPTLSIRGGALNACDAAAVMESSSAGRIGVPISLTLCMVSVSLRTKN
jgi:hypothetical protein